MTKKPTHHLYVRLKRRVEGEGPFPPEADVLVTLFCMNPSDPERVRIEKELLSPRPNPIDPPNSLPAAFVAALICEGRWDGDAIYPEETHVELVLGGRTWVVGAFQVGSPNDFNTLSETIGMLGTPHIGPLIGPILLPMDHAAFLQAQTGIAFRLVPLPWQKRAQAAA